MLAWAEKADRGKPMNIEADALRYDDVKQVSIFTGRVVLTKGSIQIRGDRLEVRQDPDGFQFGVATGDDDPSDKALTTFTFDRALPPGSYKLAMISFNQRGINCLLLVR